MLVRAHTKDRIGSHDATPCSPWPSIGICIPTFRRPDGLRKLLAHVAKLCYAGPVSIVVVENDAEGRAGLAIVEDLLPSFPLPLRGVIESRRGQTFAYNRGFAELCAAPAPDFVAVLDDDEYPAPDWLTRLVSIALSCAADIAGGPVLPVFEAPDHWLARSGLYAPARFPTGPVKYIYGAGNMLIRTAVLHRYLDSPFAEAFAFTGGSDLEFFHRCRRDGRRFAWADDALVFETTPRGRTTMRWLLLRHFRKGSERSRIERAHVAGAAACAVRWGKGLGLLAYGMASLPATGWRGRSAMMASLNAVAAGVGRIAAEFGVLYEEYRYQG
jgi:glycosyltransferase involved in cell wall biosynthesis